MQHSFPFFPRRQGMVYTGSSVQSVRHKTAVYRCQGDPPLCVIGEGLYEAEVPLTSCLGRKLMMTTNQQWCRKKESKLNSKQKK